MFAPKQYLYQNEAMGEERPKILFLSWCKKVQTSTGLQITCFHVASYRAENENLCKFGATYPHGTMLAPKQYLYQNKATLVFGEESPNI